MLQFKCFTMPVLGSDSHEDALNSFLKQHCILNIRKRLIKCEGSYFLFFLIEYMDHSTSGKVSQGVNYNSSSKKPRVDYKYILSEEDFTIFDQLRKIRKKISEDNGVPVYVVLTNEHLAEVVTKRVSTEKELREISGIGDQKVGLSGPILDFMKKLVEVETAKDETSE